jgi:phosphoglycolate phosphatase
VIPAYPVYLFDIDGTLLDSAPDICAAQSEVLTSAGCQNASFDVLRSYIGQGLRVVFGDLLPQCGEPDMERLMAQYSAVYRARQHRQTRVFPGVAEALARLGGRKSTATIKHTATTRLVLEQFGLLGYFDHVQGTDGFPPKPAPDVVLAALEALGAAPRDCLLVGDSAADMEAGRRAGVKLCAVRYGYGAPEELARWKPDHWVSDLRDLVG